MNFSDTLKSVELVLATGEVPLIVGESGVGKTALAQKVARDNQWSLIVINGNLLKEGEIGGLPTIESRLLVQGSQNQVEKKITVYAVHHKLKEVSEETARGKTVLLFIDEINRCEHTVQQELMNLILNREINGYLLPERVKIIAAMNPSNKYGADFDYQVVEMDAAQENRFVWLFMEPDHRQWIDWAMETGLEEKVIEFISTFPDYLHQIHEDDLRATPRSYERISRSYKIYKENQNAIPRAVFLNVVKGNVGRLIAEEFVSFIESNPPPLLTFEDIFSGDSLSASVSERIKAESHTRLYLSAKNLLKKLETSILKECDEPSFYINRLIEVLALYPVDLKIGMMKDIRNNYPTVYQYAIENDAFIDAYFKSYLLIRR